MPSKRVFKLKTFSRWAKNLVSNTALCRAAREIELGIFEADLGGGVCKKRVALPGRGKRGSARTLVAKKHRSAIFFLAGREKNNPGDDFSDKVIETTKIIAKSLDDISDAKLMEMIESKTLEEICND